MPAIFICLSHTSLRVVRLDASVVICDECHLGFHSYCLRPVMVNIPTSDWVCRECSGEDNAMSFADYSKTITGQQQSVLQFLDLPYSSYSDFFRENAKAISFSQSPTPFNSSQHTSVDRNLFSVGPILFIRAPDRYDFRLPSLPVSEEDYVSLNLLIQSACIDTCFSTHSRGTYNSRQPLLKATLPL